VAGLGMAGALAGCAPGVSAPASAPAAGATPGAATTLKYADKAVVMRYMTGGFTQAGPEDHLVKEYQEEALRREYGINVDIQYESASWADIDALIEVRL